MYKKKENEANAEGRSLADLLQWKGGCNGGTTTTTVTSPGETEIDGTITVSSPTSLEETPVSSARAYNDDADDDESADELDNDDDDFDQAEPSHDDGLTVYEGSSLTRRGNYRQNGQAPLTARQYDYELRVQEEKNKQLRQRIQSLRRMNQRNIRRARRARRQQNRRSQIQRRQMAQRNRNNRRRALNRRRNRRNRRRN